jgi:hypothetical protein
MKDHQVPTHQLEHEEPVVIHHPEEDMTILARWLKRGMDQGSRFWLLAGGFAVALVVVGTFVAGLSAGDSATQKAWGDLIPAKTAEDRLKIAGAHPGTPLADWARLQAAYEEYDSGLMALTSAAQRDLALPRLKKALDIFQEVAKAAPRTSPQALDAALGVARTLEARNELPEAIKQYRLVADSWKGTPEAKQAEAYAVALEDPSSAAFYRELYASKPAGSGVPPVTLPGMPPEFDLRNLGTGKPSPLDAILKPPADLDAPPPAMPRNELPKLELPDLPKSAPAPAEPAKKAEPAETPAPKPAAPPAEAKGELPKDPFAPPR